MNTEEKDPQLNMFAENRPQLDTKVEEKPIDFDMMRVASTVLMKASLNWRYKFVPEDIKTLQALPVPDVSQFKASHKSLQKISTKGAQKLHDQNIAQRIGALNRVTKAMEVAVEESYSRMDKNGKDWIETAAVFIADIMKYSLQAPDKDELKGLILMYLNGQLDFMFESTRALKAELENKDKKDETTTTSPEQ